jgi:phage/plasmid-like protein (TIGR03299 family)
MAHDITSTDTPIFHAKPAWHGLGTVLDNAPSARAGLMLAGLDWTAERMPISSINMQGEPDFWDNYRAIYRSDTNAQLAILSASYIPVQNADLADFADALGVDGTVRIESAGSLASGKRVWFLAKGESIWTTPSDETAPYLLIANSHDGSLSVRIVPTTVRVVCRNTLHMALQTSRPIRFRHTGSISDKMEDARIALGLFSAHRETYANQSRALNAHLMSREDLQRFYLDVYSSTIQPIPSAPTSPAEKDIVEDATDTISQWCTNFDIDRNLTSGAASAWTALQSITQWSDHQRRTRGANDASRHQARLSSNLWGISAAFKSQAQSMALALL